MDNKTLFEAFLSQHDADAWARTIDALAPGIHEVDRDATRVWFAFFPLPLAQSLDRAEDPDQLLKKLLIQGHARLHTQIDSSHRFLYGHRFWPRVKQAVRVRASSDSAPLSLDLADVIRDLARTIADETRRDASLILGIAAAGVMTLQQVGLAAFAEQGSGLGPPSLGARHTAKLRRPRAGGPENAETPRGPLARLAPDALVRTRARDDSQGVFGFLRGIRTEYSVTFDENVDEGSFTLINGQHLTTAAANDTRDYSADPRCFAGGPIPVECRTASCGTCWVGVLGGREKLSAVDDLESRRIKEFGYIDTADPKPHIRLACMAQASGNVTIVVPPWNGIVGKFLKAQSRQQAVGNRQ